MHLLSLCPLGSGTCVARLVKWKYERPVSLVSSVARYWLKDSSTWRRMVEEDLDQVWQKKFMTKNPFNISCVDSLPDQLRISFDHSNLLWISGLQAIDPGEMSEASAICFPGLSKLQCYLKCRYHQTKAIRTNTGQGRKKGRRRLILFRHLLHKPKFAKAKWICTPFETDDSWTASAFTEASSPSASGGRSAWELPRL